MATENDKLDYVILSPQGVVQRIESEGRDDRSIEKTRRVARKAIDGWRNSRPNEASDLHVYRVNLWSFDRQWQHGDRAKVELGDPVVDL